MSRVLVLTATAALGLSANTVSSGPAFAETTPNTVEMTARAFSRPPIEAYVDDNCDGIHVDFIANRMLDRSELPALVTINAALQELYGEPPTQGSVMPDDGVSLFGIFTPEDQEILTQNDYSQKLLPGIYDIEITYDDSTRNNHATLYAKDNIEIIGCLPDQDPYEILGIDRPAENDTLESAERKGHQTRVGGLTAIDGPADPLPTHSHN